MSKRILQCMYLCILSFFGREMPSIQGSRVQRCLYTANSGLNKLNDVIARFIDIPRLVVREESCLHCLGEVILVLPSPRTQVTADHHIEEKISKGKPVSRSLNRCFQIGVPRDYPTM